MTTVTTAPAYPEIAGAIRNIPDFPKPGIQFKDITPLLADARLFAHSIDLLIDGFKPGSVDTVVGIDARGFIFAAAAALQLRAGFVPIRKKGKLPFQTLSYSYDLEYGTDTLEIHTDAVRPGDHVLIVDDLLATGGTACATVELVRRTGGDVVGCAFVIELAELGGRKRLGPMEIHSLAKY